jgi:serine/threonine protein kinase
MYPQVFGKYVLERELARGGMARVLLATLRGAGGFEKKLVVKQIRDDLASDEDFVRRFVEEAKTTVALAHPNIVPVYELGVELGTYFLAMEYVAGASLAELLRAADGSGLSPEEGAYVGVEVCRALDYAHRRNVVHRDVTPRNVMVDDEGQVKVIDFGISAPVATAPSGQGVFGSPGHMPPEQMEGRELAPSADVFAVAVLLMELWSGKAPFRRRTKEGIEAAMRATHPKPSEADIRLLPLDGVMASAMALDPAERPRQADDLARALRKFLSGLDLGDLARKLGDRVRSVRERPPPPPSELGPVLQRPPSRPTAMQVGTKTFAARDEFKGWDKGPWPSTRRIHSTAPPPEKKSSKSEPVTRSTASRLAWRAALGAGVIAIGAFLVGRGFATPSARGSPPAATPSPPPPAAVIVSSSAVDPTPPPPAPAPSAVPSAEPDPSGRAQLALLGDGTFVTVDGVARGRAPARVALRPGSHTVLFAFPATGESKATSVTLHAGERATMRADFTGARPTIRVDR